MKKIGIFGVNGFIGHHLTRAILKETDWKIVGADLRRDRVESYIDNDRFSFQEIDIRENDSAVEKLVSEVDVVLPLAAIATPSLYMEKPLWVFELDFEANLRIVRLCVQHNKRIIWPSTSEVYGMCNDAYFNPDESPLVMGPINKERWIYSCAKQLMDRVVWAYGSHENLNFTIFRPFNWVGAGLDDIHNTGKSGARAITQFLSNILNDKDIVLVDGGAQRRSFTYVGDGVAALMKIIADEGKVSNRKIYNLGNPHNNLSIKEFAELVYEEAAQYPVFAEHLSKVKIVAKDAAEHYGDTYQDMHSRVPDISNIKSDLGWEPHVETREAIKNTLAEYQEMLGKK